MGPVTPHDAGYWIGVLFGALLVGGLCGLLPFFVGMNRNKVALGIAGLVSCSVGGLILGILLAAPIALIFTVIIVATKGPSAPR